MPPQPTPTSLPAWAPQGIADWAPLAVSAAIILFMTTALMTRLADHANAVPDGKIEEKAAAAASAPSPLNGGTPTLSTERVGTLRLVPTTRLPPAKQPVRANARCPRSSLPNPSPQARAAINMGWHVSADTMVNGYQFVMVDAGAEQASAGCVAIGASALVFNAHGLIGIAYDRNAKQSSRLNSLTVTEPGTLQLAALKGPLAKLSVSNQQIALKPLTTSKQDQASQ